MAYQDLKKSYYKLQKDAWQAEYTTRFQAPFTQHLDFLSISMDIQTSIRLFYCLTNDILLLMNNIFSKSLQLQQLISQIPPAGIAQFLHALMVEEIKSNNAIEGVHSTRREIKFAMAQQKPQKYVRLWGIVNKYNKIITSRNFP